MPWTEAGKRLLENGDAYTYTRAVLADQIDAIEAEAAADANVRLSAAHQAGIGVGHNEERARIRAAVEALPDDCHDHEGLGCERGADGRRTCYSLQRAAVLAVIDRTDADAG